MPLTNEEKLETVEQISSNVQTALGFGNDLFNNRAGFIAGDGGDWPLAEAVRAVSQFNCRRWAAADKTNFSKRVNAGNAALCGRYLDSIGEKPPDGLITNDGSAGQCATLYRVEIPSGSGATRKEFSCTTGELTSEGFTTVTRSVTNIQGPIQRIYAKATVFGACGPTTIVLAVVDANGTETLGGTLLTASAGRRVECAIVSPIIERLDGMPDACGESGGNVNPPGQTSPPPSLPPSVPINIPGLGPVTVTVTLDPDGNPVVCYEELELCVTIPVGTDDNPTPVEPVPVPPPGDVGSPGSGGPTGVGGSAEGEAPDGSVLVGLKLDLLAAPESPNTYAPGVYRGAAYIYMGTPTGLDQDFAGAMLADGQFVYAEVDNLTKWRVVSNVGYNWRVTPYYRSVET